MIYNIINDIIKNLNHFLFLIQTIYIITSTYLKFLFKFNSKYDDKNNNFLMITEITNKLSKKNIFFIKIFQAIANNNNLCNKDLFNYFIEFTDNVSYTQDDIDNKALHEIVQYAHDNNEILEIENDKPIKAGIMALVFKGKLNNKEVVIKLLRKNSREKFLKSIDDIGFLVTCSKYLPFIRDLNLNDLFHENKNIMIKQLDFNSEVDNINLFYKKFKDFPNIIIPYVYSSYTEYNNNVIIMDYINGKRIEEIDNYDKPFYAKILAKFNCKSVFYDAIYHADVHSGNILFVKNQKENNDNEYLIGIIDFGIIGKMSREEQNLFFEFFKSLVTNNYEQISLFIVENLIEPLPNTSCKKLKENEKLAILDGISGIFKKTLDENHKLFGGDEIYNSNKIFRKFGYQFSKFFCRIELAMAISENVCNCLSHDKTYFDTMLEVFKESFPSIDFF